MSGRVVECCQHGKSQATFVCGHIVAGKRDGINPGFHYDSENEDEFPDAWCDACENFMSENGGDWNDVTEAFANVTLLCSGCYLESREMAEKAGKLKVH